MQPGSCHLIKNAAVHYHSDMYMYVVLCLTCYMYCGYGHLRGDGGGGTMRSLAEKETE